MSIKKILKLRPLANHVMYFKVLLRPKRPFLFSLAFCNFWKPINAYAKFEFDIAVGSAPFWVMFFVIQRPPLLKLDNVQAKAKSWGEDVCDAILSPKPKRTEASDRSTSEK